jgi:hypothetical protein
LHKPHNQPWNHSYKLRGLGINHANQVWSTDISKRGRKRQLN